MMNKFTIFTRLLLEKEKQKQKRLVYFYEIKLTKTTKSPKPIVVNVIKP